MNASIGASARRVRGPSGGGLSWPPLPPWQAAPRADSAPPTTHPAPSPEAAKAAGLEQAGEPEAAVAAAPDSGAPAAAEGATAEQPEAQQHPAPAHTAGQAEIESSGAAGAPLLLLPCHLRLSCIRAGLYHANVVGAGHGAPGSSLQ